MAVLGLRFCARAFSSCGKRGPLLIAVRGPPTVAASLVAEHRLQTRRLSNCGSQAQSLRGMRDPPRPGLEPVSPALAGGLPTTAPPGKLLGCVYFFQELFTEKSQKWINESLFLPCFSFYTTNVNLGFGFSILQSSTDSRFHGAPRSFSLPLYQLSDENELCIVVSDHTEWHLIFSEVWVPTARQKSLKKPPRLNLAGCTWFPHQESIIRLSFLLVSLYLF